MKNEMIEKFCIQIPCKFKDILKKFNQNLKVFVIDKDKIIGSISDGDIRRKLLQKNKNKYYF